MADILVKPPHEFSKDELRAIEALVRQGGEVEGRNRAQNLRNALCLGAVFLGDRLVGVGAVKRLGAHHHTIIRCSRFKELDSFSAEIGYFYIDPSCRRKGFAGKFLLSKSPGAVYATTREDNETMHYILTKNGFTRVGRGWDSRQYPGNKIHLWVRPSA
jgi:GNAT superfamily N-acetyltransferase